jgi:hypothetical protein
MPLQKKKNCSPVPYVMTPLNIEKVCTDITDRLIVQKTLFNA